jgi:hypothetical protein
MPKGDEGERREVDEESIGTPDLTENLLDIGGVRAVPLVRHVVAP